MIGNIARPKAARGHFSRVALLVCVSFVLTGCVASTGIISPIISPPDAKIVSPAAYLNEKYGNVLEDMNEPVLDPERGSRSEAYRLLLMFAFYTPVIVRIEREADAYTLVAKVEHNPGTNPVNGKTTTHDRVVAITAENWQTFTELLRKSNFWRLSTSSNLVMASDPSQWILEAVKGDRCHVVDRYDPERYPDYVRFVSVCKYLLRLANVGNYSEHSSGEHALSYELSFW